MLINVELYELKILVCSLHIIKELGLDTQELTEKLQQEIDYYDN